VREDCIGYVFLFIDVMYDCNFGHSFQIRVTQCLYAGIPKVWSLD
jgi:hypothetical protein